MSYQPTVVKKVAETDDVILVEQITDYRNAAVAQSNAAVLAAQSRVSSAQPATRTYASDTRVTARDASNAVTGKVQAVASDTSSAIQNATYFAGEKAQAVASDTKVVAQNAGNTVAGKVQSAASDTKTAVQDVSYAASEKAHAVAADTKVAAQHASHTVVEKVQGLTASAKNVANSAVHTISETLHYGRNKAVENLKVVQENAAVLAQRAKEQAVAASSSAYHSSKDATVQGLTVAGHHTAGATSGVVEGIQHTMGVERINKPATGSVTIDDAANHTERGAATKDYTKSSTISALQMVGGYVSHGIEVTKHAVGGASQGVYEGLGGTPYKDTTVLQEGQKITSTAAREAEKQAQHHMQHPVGKQAHNVSKGAVGTAAEYVNHGLHVTKEAAGGVIQGITEHIKKAPDSHITGTLGTSATTSTVSPRTATEGNAYREESKKQTVAAIETGAQKMATSADYLKEKVNTAFSSTPASNTSSFQTEKSYTGVGDNSVFGNTHATNAIPFQGEVTGTAGSAFTTAPLKNEKVVAVVTGTPEAYAGPANPIAGESVSLFVKSTDQ